jgi:hypothetical protein
MKGENNHRAMLDRNHSTETKTKISIANKGKLLNIPRTEESNAKSSATQGTTIYLYKEDRVTLVNNLSSAVRTALAGGFIFNNVCARDPCSSAVLKF